MASFVTMVCWLYWSLVETEDKEPPTAHPNTKCSVVWIVKHNRYDANTYRGAWLPAPLLLMLPPLRPPPVPLILVYKISLLWAQDGPIPSLTFQDQVQQLSLSLLSWLSLTRAQSPSPSLTHDQMNSCRTMGRYHHTWTHLLNSRCSFRCWVLYLVFCFPDVDSTNCSRSFSLPVIVGCNFSASSMSSDLQ